MNPGTQDLKINMFYPAVWQNSSSNGSGNDATGIERNHYSGRIRQTNGRGADNGFRVDKERKTVAGKAFHQDREGRSI